MNRFKRILATLGMTCILGSAVAHAELVDRVLVQVDDQIITLSEFEAALAPLTERVEVQLIPEAKKAEMVANIRKQLLDRMIEEKISDLAVSRAGIRISEKEVDAAVEQARLRSRLDADAFEKVLLSEGLTLSSFRDRTRQQLLRSRLVGREVRSRIVITDEDVSRYYAENSGKFGAIPRYRIGHILIPFLDGKDPESVQEARDKAVGVRDVILLGESFEEVARAFSGSTTAETGGELGWVEADGLDPAITRALDTTLVGGVSDVVKSAVGFQVFKLYEKGHNDPKPLEEVKPAITDALYREAVNARFADWLKELRESTYVRIIE